MSATRDEDRGPGRDDGASTEGDRRPSRFAPLWEEAEPSRVGRPARVSRAQVVDAAVAVADERGLEAVSMRVVAKTLGVGTMTLYSHVPGRTELLDAMIDRAYADMALPDVDLAWRAALSAWATGYWTLLRAHRWMVDINPWRQPLGPHTLAVDEAGYRCLIDTGLTAEQVVETIGVVRTTVLGVARSAAVEADDESAEGIDYEGYWAASASFWEEHFDPERFPSMTRLWTVGAFDRAATPFDLRLDGLLDTIEMLVDRAQESGADGVPPFDDCLELMPAKAAEEQAWMGAHGSA